MERFTGRLIRQCALIVVLFAFAVVAFSIGHAQETATPTGSNAAAREYQTVFRLGMVSFPQGAYSHSVVLLAVGLLLFRFSKREYFKIIALLACAIGLGLGLLISISVLPNYFELRNAYLRGQSTVVVGTVENFRPRLKIGPAEESFTVGGVTFSYNALDDTPCFNDRPPFDKMIHDGVNVRIFYNEGCIQQIDIQR
jgi:hypothetical protein